MQKLTRTIIDSVRSCETNDDAYMAVLPIIIAYTKDVVLECISATSMTDEEINYLEEKYGFRLSDEINNYLKEYRYEK